MTTPLIVLLAVSLPFFGHKQRPADNLAAYIARIQQSQAAAPSPTTVGSLWTVQGRFTNIEGDYKAVNVGDIITIRIVEDTLAQNTGSTGANRAFSAQSAITGLPGRVKTGGVNPLFGANSTSDLKGKAQAASSTKLRTSVAGRVMAVLPNGSMVVEARRQVYMNNEKQNVMVRGVVRAGDVAFDNSILSTSMSDLEVELKGKGVISDANRPPNFFTRWLLKLVGF
jgi:flagellar L-ring protein precursor FlgH